MAFENRKEIANTGEPLKGQGHYATSNLDGVMSV